MKYSELRQKAQERISRKAELDKHITDYERYEDEAKQRAQLAAENGKVDEYKAACIEAQEYGTQLIVAKAQRKKIGEDAPITRDEAGTAWKEYVSGYNKQFEKMYADFQKKRKDLLNAYKELVELQRKAFEVREWLADNSGIDTRITGLFDNPFEREFPCKTLPITNDNQVSLKMNGTNIKNSDALVFLEWCCREQNIGNVDFVNGTGEIGNIKNILQRGTTRPF